MKSRSELATAKNYRRLRTYINDEIEAFRINSENWVLALFKQIPSEPSQEGIEALNHWINQYLPKRIAREIAAKFHPANPSKEKTS